METIRFVGNKTGKTLHRFDMTEEEFHSYDNEYCGFCLACGSQADECEPDARRYKCGSCGQPNVYGLQELLIMGFISISGEVAS